MVKIIIEKTVKNSDWWAAFLQQALSIYAALMGILGTLFVVSTVLDFTR